MEKKPRTLARRLADFFDVLAADRRPSRPRRLLPDEEKRNLALQLMATLNRDVLTATGHRRLPPAPPPRPRERRPSPSAVGDLSRAR
jgi:hypothetical protein